VAKPKMPAPCYAVGDHVNHAANADGLFPAGCGTVSSVVPWNTGDGYSYQVKCDKTGSTLPVNFKESELSPV
jgi:hypothetical protein